MDLKALDTVKRIDLLKGLASADQLLLVESTLTDYIADSNIDNTELTQYRGLLSQVKSIPTSTLTDLLDTMRSNYISKIFENPCSKQWNDLTPTNNKEIKFCGDCGRNVYKVHNKEDYRKRKQLNQCVAIDFYLKEKYQDSASCDLTIVDNTVLLGSPATIENE